MLKIVNMLRVLKIVNMLRILKIVHGFNRVICKV